MTTGPDAPTRPRQELLTHAMGMQLSRLQREYARQVAPPTPWAAATMAALRRADPGRPEADPATWEITYSALPQELLGAGDLPSSAERAVHAALVLYAVHQASQGTPMHRQGVSIGRALRRLPGAEDDKGPVLRRFTSLLAASTFAETTYHLRGLMTLLRREGIALDHVRLCRDLDFLQRADRAPGVRMRWGRDYFGSRATSADTDTDSDPAAEASLANDSPFGPAGSTDPH